jgi:hypothetical protein
MVFTKRLIDIDEARDAIYKGTENKMELRKNPAGEVVLRPVGRTNPSLVLGP